MAVTINRKLTFQQPSISTREYITIGASGWPECFGRKEADAALVKFIGESCLRDLLSNFNELIVLRHDGVVTWTNLTGYLGRVFSIKADDVPYKVAVAFWGHILLSENEKDAGN